MELRYYSQWVFYITALWYACVYFKIDSVTSQIHPYYMTMFAMSGFLILSYYWIHVRKIRFEFSFYVGLLIVHALPVYLSYSPTAPPNALKTFILSILLYLGYCCVADVSPLETYLRTQPSSWKSLETACKTHFISPFCDVYLSLYSFVS